MKKKFIYEVFVSPWRLGALAAKISFPRFFSAMAVFLAATFSVATSASAATSWNPYYDREDDTPKQDKRTYVRGSRREMGEVMLLSGGQAGGQSGGQAGGQAGGQSGGQAGGQAWLQRTEGDGSKTRTELRVGDRVMLDSTLETAPGTVLEILFGNNARVRLGENSLLRMLDISTVNEEGAVVTNRKIMLEKGTVRVRVKDNTRIPSPVYLLCVDSEAAVGLPALTCQGGVDVVAYAADNDKGGGRLSVLNGGMTLTRSNKLVHKKDAVTLGKEQQIGIPAPEKELEEPEKIPPERLAELQKQNAFSTDPFGHSPLAPVPQDRELDGP